MTVVGVGTDLVDVDRFRMVVARRPRIIHRLFTDAEQAYATERRDPMERYAGRFAAKEAVVKAMGIGLFKFPIREVEILPDTKGRPEVLLIAAAAEMAVELGIGAFQMSISHTASMAQATAIAVGTE